MKVVVYGLGIIGASVAASLRRAGHIVSGRNRSREPLEYALTHDMIDEVTETYDGADIVFLALPPRVAMHELAEGRFPDGCIVTDICGVKRMMEDAVYCVPRKWRYVGTHPMAGKETSGIRSASATLFKGANFIVTPCERTDPDALETVESLARAMGFGRIVRCAAAEHDRKIAITSQLAHIVSNAYVKSPYAAKSWGFTGGSFQDMTRIAGVDENLWTELYFCNRESLLEETEGLIERLTEYRDALASCDEEKMRALLREGREKREEIRRGR